MTHTTSSVSPTQRPRRVTGAPSTMGDDVQLNTTTMIRHAARTYPEQPIVYRTPDDGWAEYSYADAYARIQRGANVLTDLGVVPGGKVGVLDWNSRRHFELYWSIPGIGAVMVQLNLRLGAEDMAYVLTDSGTTVVCVDETLLPIAEAVAPHVPHVRTWVVMTDKPMAEVSTTLENAVHFEDLLAAADEKFDWPEIDESSAFAACYTTGTTGKPKGVFYSHRSIYLHTTAITQGVGLGVDDCVMLITPMFHGSGWGLPQGAVYNAAKVVLPGRYRAEDTEPLVDAMIREGVTVANGAPAIFNPMLDYVRTMDTKPDFSSARFMSGATEPSLTLMQGLRELTGAEVVHAYGATETSPLVTLNRFKPSVRAAMDDEELFALKRKQGLPVSGVDIVLLDGIGNAVPHDGSSQGEICVRGPWITATYNGMTEDDLEGRFVDGYWRSGDVGTIDENGYLKVTDRIKDVIKSGGEWISSIDMENLLLSHEAIADAVVVGLSHPKWQERPFVLAVPKPGQTIELESVHAHLSQAFASWQLPEAVEVVAEIPRTTVGKFDKKRIRSEYADFYERTTHSE
ncbi:MAG: long-chain-fatty-acid--CoA ligase [Brevibacterium yomogidense]|uniref:long-chain-fatty-acid--CoA ligase n=1 Tax=Brevibacterium sp. Mu109 TaxID=1255669 RepID=UPI000C556411|nr:long-chain-fatty-acid--CoA ligase [Brevibacterium sp. Mu109]SMX89128.1 fatty-acyl-CoA synthase [Brevibacterium sp. Mu109]